MSEAKHTPGPWRVCGGYTPAYIAIHSAEGYIIRGLADRIDHEEHGEPIKAPSFESQRANARLIARAPDMADEIERLRADVGMLQTHAGWCFDENVRLKAEVERLTRERDGLLGALSRLLNEASEVARDVDANGDNLISRTAIDDARAALESSLG